MANVRQDAPEQLSERHLNASDSLNVRNIFVAEAQERNVNNQLSGRASGGEFSLGVPKDKQPDMAAIFKKDPEFERRFFDMTGENGNVVEPPLGGIVAPDSYRNHAFREMIGKYGADRVKETFAAMEQMGRKAEWSGRDLRPDEPTFAAQNKKLELLSNIMKPGKLEEIQRVEKALKAEGSTKPLSLEQMNDAKLLKHLQDPAQRKAHIEFQENPTNLPGLYLKETPNHKDLSPVQNLEGFKRFQEKFAERERERAKPYLDEINKAGEDPTKHLSDALRRNRVLMIGEQHSAEGPMHKFGADAIKDFKAAGATHLALEMTQSQLDKYSKSRDLKDLPEAFRTQDFARMIDNARASGIKVVGVDNGTGDVDAKAAQERDNFMARKIKQIVDADKNNKVVFWSGMMHGADTTAGASRSAADILRSQKVPIATAMEQSSANPTDDLSYFSKYLSKPVAIDTSKTPKIAQKDLWRSGNDIEERYGLWNSVLIFPKGK